MVTNTVPVNTPPPKPQLLLIIEFQKAYEYLDAILRPYFNSGRSDAELAHAALQLIVKEVLDYANRWCDSSSMEHALQELIRVTRNEDLSYEVARHVHDLISEQLLHELPGFSSDRYEGKYTFDFIGGRNARVAITYWENGVPASIAKFE